MFEEHNHISSKTWGGSELEKHFFLQFLWCDERWGGGVLTGAWVLPACSAPFSAGRAGAEWRIEALCGVGILKASAGRQLLEWSSLLSQSYGLTGTRKFMVLFRLKMWPHQLQKGRKQGGQREYWSRYRGIEWTIQVPEVCSMHNRRLAFSVLLWPKAAGFGTDVPGVLLQQGH